MKKSAVQAIFVIAGFALGSTITLLPLWLQWLIAGLATGVAVIIVIGAIILWSEIR